MPDRNRASIDQSGYDFWISAEAARTNSGGLPATGRTLAGWEQRAVVRRGELAPAAHSELLKDVHQMHFDRGRADAEPVRHFLVAETRRHVAEDFTLPGAEALLEQRLGLPLTGVARPLMVQQRGSQDAAR